MQFKMKLYLFMYMWVRVWYGEEEIFQEQADLFSRARVKIKPESEMSCHITLTSVISGLFFIPH